MDKMVEIARFQYPAEAQTLIALLKSEGIECYLRNEYTSQLYASYVDVGGARVEILESDVPEALKIMKAGGYDIPEEDEEAEQIQVVAGWARHIPFLRNYTLEKQIVILFVIIAVLLVLLIFFGSQISSN
ncbi:putative signal transducing protein [Parabacteroides faecis]|uniref:putative signal transducing protein n=1 Tax=Parabacteroides faecis TaxID=1217282 RepID=UPI0035212C17